MSGRVIVRAIVFVVAAALAYDVGETALAAQHWSLPLLAVVGIAIFIGLIFMALTPFIIIAPYHWIREQIRKAEVSDLIAGVIGLVVGLLIAALLAIPLSQLSFADLGRWVPTAVAVLCAWLGVTVAVLRKNDFIRLASMAFSGRAARRAAREEHEGEEHEEHEERDQTGGRLRDRLTGRGKRANDHILLDTSSIIDGRIADITQTGFITGTLVAPRFVLEELQHIADSADGMRRNRGRRGLEILQRLQKDSNVPVEITDSDPTDVVEVDAKLVKLARQWRCAIITNDFNLNRVAELQGVKVLNINELAHAVKPILLPGEDMMVKIIQEGKEAGQGVGYLDDGTMIVVENGRAYLQSTIEVTVTRVLQTVAGRMIFAHPKQTAPSMAAARRTGTA